MKYSKPATCQRCGTSIIKNAPRQKYCVACACDVHQEQQRQAAKRYMDKLNAHKKATE